MSRYTGLRYTGRCTGHFPWEHSRSLFLNAIHLKFGFFDTCYTGHFPADIRSRFTCKIYFCYFVLIFVFFVLLCFVLCYSVVSFFSFFILVVLLFLFSFCFINFFYHYFLFSIFFLLFCIVFCYF